ncbi:hypothetical protein V6N12_008489 [Hibiscus sabdariffa]|uniref:Uncharacterized protein n=1 Tax=Hibiscus sabdariffa TaxID=183260 RepID=A0ABR2BKU3_9ROSI
MFPLETVNPNSISVKSPYSMGNLADSLPKGGGSQGSSGGYNSNSGTSTVNVLVEIGDLRVKAWRHFCLNVESESRPSVQSSAGDPLDMFFSSSSASARRAAQASGCNLQPSMIGGWTLNLGEQQEDLMKVAQQPSLKDLLFPRLESRHLLQRARPVLEHEESNMLILVQRALLFESMEKYKLGAKGPITVLKIDPGYRIARSTVHRLAKVAA